ncbi:MAG TPA: hypothetical protein DDX10_02160 [Rikenellaceae bacterium]|nr:hypothetical protein [Rikenellaceae bacterium]
MAGKKLTKVVLDSDVIIHFIKGNCLNILPKILPSYSFILLDIVYYCKENNITYFTTMDFLYQAMKSNVMTEKECDEFIAEVTSKGSKLPVTKMNEFTPRLVL